MNMNSIIPLFSDIRAFVFTSVKGPAWFVSVFISESQSLTLTVLNT